MYQLPINDAGKYSRAEIVVDGSPMTQHPTACAGDYHSERGPARSPGGQGRPREAGVRFEGGTLYFRDIELRFARRELSQLSRNNGGQYDWVREKGVGDQAATTGEAPSAGCCVVA